MRRKTDLGLLISQTRFAQPTERLDKLLSVIQADENRIITGRRLAEEHCMALFQGGQDTSVFRANVVAEEIFARVIKGSHRKYRVALVQNGLRNIRSALRDQQATKAELASLQNRSSAGRRSILITVVRN